MAQDQYTLGQSERVLQFTKEEIIQADLKLNKLLVHSFTYSSIGLLNGALLSVFFKNKVRIIGYAIGFGLGMAIHKDGSQLINHIRAQK